MDQATTQIGFEVFKQLPAVAAIIYVVVLFLRSLDRRDDNFRLIAKEWSESQNLSRQQMAEHFQNVVDRNNNVIENVSGVITRCQDRIVKIDQGNK